MKKSARVWAVAFFVSLLPLAFVMAEPLGLVVPQEEIYVYISLGLGLISSVPIWGAALVRARLGKHRQDLLSLVAILLSCGFALFSNRLENYWQPLALISIMLLGGLIQNLQITKVHGSARKFTGLIPSKVALIDGREIEHLPVADLEIGNVILVRPGGAVPADGYVIQGHSLVSETKVTGETEPTIKGPGDWVLAGSENVAGRDSSHGPLTIRVSAVGDDLLIHQLESSVDFDNTTPARYTIFGSRASNALTLLTISVSLIVSGTYLVIGKSLLETMSVAVSLLVSAQVAVMAIAAPLGSIASSIKAVKLGVLIRNRKAFELLNKINHVVFNKTGVLTRGHNQVGAIHLARNTSIGSEDELLALAAAVELGTSHELGHLIIQEAAKRGLELPTVTEIAPIPGLGVSARFDGSLVQVGNAGMVNVSGINMNPYDLFRVSNAYQEGSSVVFISIDELLVGYIEFPDEIRANAQQAIVELSGKHAITVLSGDATAVVEKVTTGLGLSEFAAEVLSTRKADWIKERRASGSKLLLIADGHYDASPLAEADVALAFGAGHDVNLSSADLIQISENPLTVATLMKLSRRVQSRTLRNIVLGITISLGMMVASAFGVSAPIIALVGLVLTWYLNSSIVRLVK